MTLKEILTKAKELELIVQNTPYDDESYEDQRAELFDFYRETYDELISEVEAMKSALKRIASEKHSVESKSTGQKQWFKTFGADIAIKALARAGYGGNGE